MCIDCKCAKSFSTSQAEELIKKHGLTTILFILSLASRNVSKDGDHPGYDLVADRLNHLTELIKK